MRFHCNEETISYFSSSSVPYVSLSWSGCKQVSIFTFKKLELTYLKFYYFLYFCIVLWL